MIAAVLPAAGHSSRMGRPKLALPFGTGTVLERVIAALRSGGVDTVVVVTAPHVAELDRLAAGAGALVYQLAEATNDMRATVEHGLSWLEDRLPLPEAFLLAPADQPTLDAGLVRALLDAWIGARDRSIAVPVHAGRRGHPTLIGWRHVAGIRALPPDRGINTYLRDHPNDVLEVVVSDSAALADLDTPEEYERLRAELGPS